MVLKIKRGKVKRVEDATLDELKTAVAKKIGSEEVTKTAEEPRKDEKEEKTEKIEKKIVLMSPSPFPTSEVGKTRTVTRGPSGRLGNTF